ncbi:hypothetical protein GW537_19300 (plasmid) [Piscirickettsia salmonis]|uniref:hypothetical protein n=1 Tax=Piscirickettsia salmonis TaxID=1238 RepID=UPI00137C3E12|nr:hypothetical protein [Piscirickettsia salmonis]QHS31127.1 hypothetical protein GW537_19300 [Piscirickettsia salmonis]
MHSIIYIMQVRKCLLSTTHAYKFHVHDHSLIHTTGDRACQGKLKHQLALA